VAYFPRLESIADPIERIPYRITRLLDTPSRTCVSSASALSREKVGNGGRTRAADALPWRNALRARPRRPHDSARSRCSLDRRSALGSVPLRSCRSPASSPCFRGRRQRACRPPASDSAAWDCRAAAAKRLGFGLTLRPAWRRVRVLPVSSTRSGTRSAQKRGARSVAVGEDAYRAYPRRSAVHRDRVVL
jgi:hypothetical protein